MSACRKRLCRRLHDAGPRRETAHDRLSFLEGLLTAEFVQELGELVRLLGVNQPGSDLVLTQGVVVAFSLEPEHGNESSKPCAI